jgi:hypothetical protein
MFPIRTDDEHGAPDDDDFLAMFFVARKLEGLASMILGDITLIICHTLTFVSATSHWSVHDIKRLVYDPRFQSILTNLKETQVKMHYPFVTHLIQGSLLTYVPGKVQEEIS